MCNAEGSQKVNDKYNSKNDLNTDVSPYVKESRRLLDSRSRVLDCVSREVDSN